MKLQLSVLLFNPLSIVRTGRLVHLDWLFRHSSVVILPGTQSKHIFSKEVVWFELEHFLIVSHGWARGPFLNKSCGITIMLNQKKFPVTKFAPLQWVRLVPLAVF